MTDIERILIPKSQKYPQKCFLRTDGKDVHTKFGVIPRKDVENAKDGEQVLSNRNEKYTVISPSFIDLYMKIKRTAQIIPLKDVGTIISFCGIGKDTTIVDAGAGSGGLSLFLAHVAKKVYTFDALEENATLVENNAKKLGLKNIEVKHKDVYNGYGKKNVDVVTIDIPEPWQVVKHAYGALKIGGFMVCYSPCVPPLSDFLEEVNKNENLLIIHTMEIIERYWEFKERKIRPKSAGIGHSGFLSFVRKIA
jgi:tRNA (adenine57-N1/adenine58-N1)-methyltransferase catalytic subunit